MLKTERRDGTEERLGNGCGFLSTKSNIFKDYRIRNTLLSITKTGSVANDVFITCIVRQ